MSSSPPVPLAGGHAPRRVAAQPDVVPGTAQGHPAIVLGASLHYPLAWWMDPIRTILFVVLPVFCAAAYFNRFSYWTFNASRDFITPQTFRLGLFSMAMMLLGILIGRLFVRRRDVVSLLDPERVTRVLVRYGWVTIAAYAILFGTLVVHYDFVLSLLRGNIAASTEVRDALGRIPGITSFVQFGTVYLALISALAMMTNYKVPPRLWAMTGFIFGLVFARSILASERVALLEALAALGVVPLAYRWRPSLWRTLLPFIGIFALFLTFAGFEYFRSWQFYRGYYDNYLDFIAPRFAGYFSTSINNGSGAYLIYGQYDPHPEITVGWVTQFPVLGSFFKSTEIPLIDRFLTNYATPEFNNPGGLYAAYLDYPFPIASVFMAGVGIIVGMTHRAFQNRTLLGLLLYPAIFLGTTDLIRVLYVTNTRTLPLFLGAFIAVWAIRPLQLPRDTFLSRVSKVSQGPRAS